MKKQLKNQLGDALLLGGYANNEPQHTIVPKSEMPMVLTLDQLSPNPDNPRTSRNPRFDDIKASIKARGLDTVPKVTRDPQGEAVYIFSDGGNTRYQILSELWQETGEERFYRVHCLFKPWPGRLQCIIGHLAENDMRGELTFIEKAKGVSKARTLFEDKLDKKVTLRELSSLLDEEGFPVHYSSISKMEDTLDYLYPYMPMLLDEGMGRGQIETLLLLRSNVLKVAKQFFDSKDDKKLLIEIFSSVCNQLDSPELFSLDVFRDELIGELVKNCPHSSFNYDRWVFELDSKKQKKGSIDIVSIETSHVEPQVENIEVYAHKNDTSKIESVRADIPESDVQKFENVNSEVIESNISELEKTESLISESDLTKVDNFQSNPKKIEKNSTLNESNSSFENMSLDTSLLINESSEDYIPKVSEVVSIQNLWPISPLLDDIEHIQREVFLNAFSLADSLGLGEFISQSNSNVKSSGYHVVMDEKSSASLVVLKLLSEHSSETSDQVKSNVFHEVLIGSYVEQKEPLFNDEQVLQLMKVVRLLRRLRELQIKSSMNFDEVINTDEYA
ncbi:conserved hypothetical protein [Xenorhabdus nematophila str. Anatoliense]|nr:conserved hypothetical protein [Xenorhabdus nematophila str. Anatoliense]